MNGVINLQELPLCENLVSIVVSAHLTEQSKFQLSVSMCTHTHIIYSTTEKRGQLYSPPPQPLFTASATHISSIILFYGTHKMIIMITIITTHIKCLNCTWEYEWGLFFTRYSVFLSGELKQARLSLQWNSAPIWYWFTATFWNVLFRIIFYLGNFGSVKAP